MSITVGNCTPCVATTPGISLLGEGKSSVGSSEHLETTTATVLVPGWGVHPWGTAHIKLVH